MERARNRIGDQPTMEAPILDEHFTRVHSGNDHSCKIESGLFTFERAWVDNRLAALLVEMNSMLRHKFEVGPIADHGKYKIVLNRDFSIRRSKANLVRKNFSHGRMEVRLHLAVLDPILDIRFD